MKEDELTPLQQDERDAVLRDREAILRVVSGLRRYRLAVAKLLASRYQGGSVDGVATHELASEVESIEASDIADDD